MHLISNSKATFSQNRDISLPICQVTNLNLAHITAHNYLETAENGYISEHLSVFRSTDTRTRQLQLYTIHSVQLKRRIFKCFRSEIVETRLSTISYRFVVKPLSECIERRRDRSSIKLEPLGSREWHSSGTSAGNYGLFNSEPLMAVCIAH